MRASKACDTPRAPVGQAYIYFALAIPVLCGMLALAVDVGTTTARYQALRHSANNAAYAGAYALYGSHSGATSALTDTAVWNAMASKLTTQGLTLMTAPGGAVPSDPCAAGYLQNQVAMTATYLDPNDSIITSTTNTPWLVGSGSIPPLAWGVQVTLGTCQPAGFGGVLGHPSYTIWVSGSAGRQLPGPNYSPTPVPTSTPGQPVAEPYAVSGAPNGNCTSTTNKVPPAANGDSEQFYCPSSYTIGSQVFAYANGRGLGNNYGHDANFKGYTGGIYNLGEQHWSSGGGDNGLSSCPPLMSVPIISGVHHSGNADYFVVLETVVISMTTCDGTQMVGTIVSVYDPYGYGIVAPPATPTPTATATNTSTPTNTPTPVPTATPVPIQFRAAASTGSSGHVNGLTIAVPTGTQSGDVLITQLVVNSDPFAITMPAAWTQIRQDNYSSSGITQLVYYHVAGASEPPSYTWSWSPGVNAAGAMGAYSGVNNTNPIAASSGDASQTATLSETVLGLTTTTNNARVLGLFSILTQTTITLPASETQRWTAQGPNITLASGDEVQLITGPTGPRTATSGAMEHMIGQLVALNPLPLPATPTPTNTPLPTNTPTVTPTSPATPTMTPTAQPTATTAPPVIHYP